MFSRRLVSRFTTSAATKPHTRAFSSTQWQQRTPALSDIQPNQEKEFDEKQQQFRQQLQEQTRRQREQESVSQQPASHSPTTAKSTDSSSILSSNNPSDKHAGQGLGSLSTATGEAARQQDESNSNKKKPSGGRLSNLIYGTEEGREMDRDIERSFSQVLARGKYVHSIVFHEVKPDKVDEYVELVGSWYPRMASMPENKVHLVGSWRTEVGDCDTFGTSYRTGEGWHCF